MLFGEMSAISIEVRKGLDDEVVAGRKKKRGTEENRTGR